VGYGWQASESGPGLLADLHRPWRARQREGCPPKHLAQRPPCEGGPPQRSRSGTRPRRSAPRPSGTGTTPTSGTSGIPSACGGTTDIARRCRFPRACKRWFCPRRLAEAAGLAGIFVSRYSSHGAWIAEGFKVK